MRNLVNADGRQVPLRLHDAEQRGCRVRGNSGRAGEGFGAAMQRVGMLVRVTRGKEKKEETIT
jgi:hypothetical protein